MTRVYISDYGDDKNDGRTRETAIYSWTRCCRARDERKNEKVRRRASLLKSPESRHRHPVAERV